MKITKSINTHRIAQFTAMNYSFISTSTNSFANIDIRLLFINIWFSVCSMFWFIIILFFFSRSQYLSNIVSTYSVIQKRNETKLGNTMLLLLTSAHKSLKADNITERNLCVHFIWDLYLLFCNSQHAVANGRRACMWLILNKMPYFENEFIIFWSGIDRPLYFDNGKHLNYNTPITHDHTIR